MTTSAVVPELFKPRGRYPHFRRAGDFIFVSGLSSRQADNTIVGASADAMGTMQLDIRAQTRGVIENLSRILAAAGARCPTSSTSSRSSSTWRLRGYNEVYGEYFSHDGPARTTVAVHQLPHPHMRIEIKAVAWKPK
jgi:2-aminomuconate deaminase